MCMATCLPVQLATCADPAWPRATRIVQGDTPWQRAVSLINFGASRPAGASDLSRFKQVCWARHPGWLARTARCCDGAVAGMIALLAAGLD